MLSLSTAPARRRGAQPLNTNALKHGFYSARSQRPLLALQLDHLRLVQHSYRLAARDGEIGLLLTQLFALRKLVLQIPSLPRLTFQDPRDFQRAGLLLRTVGLSLQVKLALGRLLEERLLLPGLADHALALCLSEFSSRCIVPHWAFVPLFEEKNRIVKECHGGSRRGAAPVSTPGVLPEPLRPLPEATASLPADPARIEASPPAPYRPSSLSFHLTDAQWDLLEPLLTALRREQDCFKKRARPRLYHDRFLLDLIFTKLAFALRWEEIGPSGPVRACQLLYKQLYRSGCLISIYTLLHNHLAANGRQGLPALVKNGAFAHQGRSIFLTDPANSSWEHLTGLLLLQRALVNRRRQKRLRQQIPRRRTGSLHTPNASSLRPRTPGGYIHIRRSEHKRWGRPALSPDILQLVNGLFQRFARAALALPPGSRVASHLNRLIALSSVLLPG